MVPHRTPRPPPPRRRRSRGATRKVRLGTDALTCSGHQGAEMLKLCSGVCISSQTPRLAHHSSRICLLHPHQQQWAPRLWLLCLPCPPARQRAWCPSLAKEASTAQLSTWETKNRQTPVIFFLGQSTAEDPGWKGTGGPMLRNGIACKNLHLV